MTARPARTRPAPRIERATGRHPLDQHQHDTQGDLMTSTSADKVRALHCTDDVQQRALDALTTGQETFSRAQVAYLMHLAFTAALDGVDHDPSAGPTALTLAYRAGHADGFAAGEESAFAEVHADLRYALGGPKAKTMADAVKTAQRATGRQLARAEWTRTAREPRPHGLVLDDPQWPPVAIPGQPVRTQQLRSVA